MAKTLNYRDPIGVAPPAFIASAVMADLKDRKAGEAKFHPERAPIVLSNDEAAKRFRLFALARKGSPAAIATLRDEYHLRLIPVDAHSN